MPVNGQTVRGQNPQVESIKKSSSAETEAFGKKKLLPILSQDK
jgi:hypothetical protein